MLTLLWGVPLWALLVCAVIAAVSAWWRIRRETSRSPLPIFLLGLASVLEAAAIVCLCAMRLFAWHVEITALFTFLSWLLETWAKRASLKCNQAEVNNSAISASENGSPRWYSK